MTDGGRWRRLRVNLSGAWRATGWDHGNWTAGFSVGCLWRLYAHTGTKRWAALAAACLPHLAARARDPNTHDVGYLFWPSFAVGADLVGDAAMRTVALEAARTLAGRMQPGGYLAAWGPVEEPRARASSTIDTMMNLALLWWSGDPALEAAARTHAETSLMIYLRPDGSTYHRAWLDPVTGAVQERGTFQGLAPDSCWSRGQAWALAGFAQAWRRTADPLFRAAADRAADYFLQCLQGRRVPPWDFGDRDRAAALDSSAAVIATYGLMDLERWDEARRVFFGALDACLNRGDGDGLLLHACYSRPHNDAVDAAVIWGDYFCLSCLARIPPTP